MWTGAQSGFDWWKWVMLKLLDHSNASSENLELTLKLDAWFVMTVICVLVLQIE